MSTPLELIRSELHKHQVITTGAAFKIVKSILKDYEFTKKTTAF